MMKRSHQYSQDKMGMGPSSLVALDLIVMKDGHTSDAL